MRVELMNSAWLRRTLAVELDGQFYNIEYDGRGLGYERVLINDETAVTRLSWLWFVPRLEFFIGHIPAAIEVSVSKSMRIRALRMLIRDQVVYSEGES